VLGLLCERRTHGWDLVRALRPGGEVGDVWSCSRPLVYRAIDVLVEQGLVDRHGAEESAVGPSRTLLAPTTAGRRALGRWLGAPVAHLRDVRSELILKLLLAERLGRSTERLLERQRRVFAPLERSLARRLEASAGFERTLALWRHTNAEATLRFLDQLDRR